MTFTIEQLQREITPWAERNFGKLESWQPLIGICEEQGELYTASSIEEHEDAIADMVIYLAHYCSRKGWNLTKAIALALSVHRRDEEVEGLDIQDLLLGPPSETWFPYLPAPVTTCIGKLCHHHLKASQGIRGSSKHHDRLGRVFAGLLYLSLGVRVTQTQCVQSSNPRLPKVGDDSRLLEVVCHVWGRVKKRDFVTDPMEGGESD